MAEDTCSHLNAITKVKHATRRECEECVKIGASWVPLRTCQTSKGASQLSVIKGLK